MDFWGIPTGAMDPRIAKAYFMSHPSLETTISAVIGSVQRNCNEIRFGRENNVIRGDFIVGIQEVRHILMALPGYTNQGPRNGGKATPSDIS